MKFGKTLLENQIPEYSRYGWLIHLNKPFLLWKYWTFIYCIFRYYLSYKALKKLINNAASRGGTTVDDDSIVGKFMQFLFKLCNFFKEF